MGNSTINTTFTPLIIEGKIYVVVDAPEKPDFADYDIMKRDYPDMMVLAAFKEDCNRYQSQLFTCTKYPTIESDAPYWEERIGQRVEVDDFTLSDIGYGDVAIPKIDGRGTFNEPKPTYAIPPQQKQGDEWDEAEIQAKNYILDTAREGTASEMVNAAITYLRNNYNLTKK